MKSAGTLMLFICLLVIAVLGYFNFKQTQTIQLLNEEIIEQARLRHLLILEKHVLKKKVEKLEKNQADSVR